MFEPLEGRVSVQFDPELIDPVRLARLVTERSGMRAEVQAGEVVAGAVGSGTVSWWSRWGPTVVSGVALGVGHELSWNGAASYAVVPAFVVAVLASGFELVPKAWRSVRGRRLDIHVLMVLAIGGALAIGAWDEAATVAFLFGLSEALEALSLERARGAVRALLDIAPETAERVEGGGTTRVVAASEIEVGELVRVRAGNRVPVDGVVRSGRSSVDQQSITGESVPILREEGDEVFAGTVNGEGALEIEATKALDDSVVTRIVERVRAAQAGRTPVERTIERFASIYTPLAVVLAVLVMVVPPMLGVGPSWRHWFRAGFGGAGDFVSVCAGDWDAGGGGECAGVGGEAGDLDQGWAVPGGCGAAQDAGVRQDGDSDAGSSGRCGSGVDERTGG